MAKLNRYFQKIFGSSTPSKIGKFGSLADGTPSTTTDPSVIQSLSRFLTGWTGAILGNNSPAIEDMNALHYLQTYQLAYLMQQGVPEWDDETDYHYGQLCSSSGVIYKSIVNNNTNNAVTNEDFWAQMTPALTGDIATCGFSTTTLTIEPQIVSRVSEDGYQLTTTTDPSNLSGLKWDNLSQKLATMQAACNLTLGTASVANSWQGITYGKPTGTTGLFVAIAASGTTDRSMTSPDGITWTTRVSLNIGLTDISYGNNRFIAYSSNGNTGMTSTNGTTWTSWTGPVPFSRGLEYSPFLELWVIAQFDAGQPIFTSPDGITWTSRTNPQPNYSMERTMIGPDRVIIQGYATTGPAIKVLVQSQNGTSWTIIGDSTVNAETSPIRGAKYSGDRYVMITLTKSYVSLDGLSWVSYDLPISFSSSVLTAGNGVFVITDAFSGNVIVSRDGKNWVFGSNNTGVTGTSNWMEGVYAKGTFVYVGFSGTNRVMRSNYDGVGTF